MSLYTVQQTLFRLKKDKPFSATFKELGAAALATLDLSEQERDAVANGDLAGLYRMGVHPLLLAPYARLMGIARPRYQELLAPLAGLQRLKS
ncbi:hypothetical protein [Lacisediminimonas profundi]|uniref:hypothetical protein n=1 Tax=Lacisediminimonas profundi TaxID=2603856 RepID=UPI00124B1B77|nr:hypothetical protein [Lacisediminimonas profundi]